MSGWILCKDRLPADGDSVLVTDVFQNIWIGSYYSQDFDGHSCWDDDHGYIIQSDEVLAWMPLPEPYEGE